MELDVKGQMSYKLTSVNSLVTDISLRRTPRLVLAVYLLFYHNQSLSKRDTSQVEKRPKYLSERTDNGLINRFR